MWAEQRNPASLGLDEMPAEVDLLVEAWRKGRSIYVGAGTSGRIAALDAADLAA